MTSPFETRLLRGYRGIESFMGSDASHVSRTRLVATTLRVVFNEMVGAMDGFSSGIFHYRTADVTMQRGDRITLDGVSFDVVDIRDSEDGTSECRAIRAELTS